MFSGIVENQTTVMELINRPGVLIMTLQRPENFADLKTGDSIAVNGICLTLEKFDQGSMTFALGEETLKVTGWSPDFLRKQNLNLERSMRLGDRLHGHLVLGHVDACGEVVARDEVGEGLKLTIRFPEKLKTMIWTKGSLTVNGVSLTINQVDGLKLTVGLIPHAGKVEARGHIRAANEDGLRVGFHERMKAEVAGRGSPQHAAGCGCNAGSKKSSASQVHLHLR